MTNEKTPIEKFDARQLKLYAQRFAHEWDRSAALKERREVHERRRRRARAMLTRSRIPTLNESELRELFSDSEAFRFWSSQEYEFGKRLEKYGLTTLRELLLELVARGERGPHAAHLQTIWARRGLGPQLATELLAYRFPARFAPNSKEIVAALQFFSFDASPAAQSTLAARQRATAKRESDVQEYLARCRVLEQIKSALEAAGVKAVDFLTTQMFAWWLGQAESDGAAAPEFDVVSTLDRAMSERGLQFSRFSLGSFFTALQTKGFVLLTGISGVGKTQLARTFAEILQGSGPPAPADSHGTVAVTVSPALLQSGRVPLPAHRFAPGDRVLLSVDGHSQNARVMAGQKGAGELVLRGVARRWLENQLSVGDVLRLEPEIDNDRDAVNFRLFAANAAAPIERDGSNLLFLPVRPDWRDGKSLLGYFNPLTNHYESTLFLQFVQHAASSFRERDGRAWFVLLDEMNLARVEHYFSDLLSVLETGRDEQGWTREALRFEYPESASGETPPRELFLPPNLFFIGTVNLDESTHTFSPKVLDRAWTLQLDAIDFRHYPPPPRQDNNGGGLTAEERRALWQLFTSEGRFEERFERIGKASIAQWAHAHPEIGVRLQTLNEQLRPHGLHFGYRVFDEMVAFLAASQQQGAFGNGAFGASADASPPSTLEVAFDAAVAAKVLSRLHGSRERLQAPLRTILAWCLNPDAPATETVARIFEGMATSDDSEAALRELKSLPYRLPHSASIASDLWRAALMDGYALFGAA
ncbi:MAG: 5-methylcytosine-specific restriction enzyme [Abditibacteriota bacterium]|nr:5-methylcytosine-specific restriction enzyme [Abditibacteriota bacterium]